MIEGSDVFQWLLLPLDNERGHNVSSLVAWHGRLMVLAWAVLSPSAILAARYFKIMPNQNWPVVLDNPLWWRWHWKIQVLVAFLSVFALGLAIASNSARVSFVAHSVTGYALLALMFIQILGGVLRGSKGGPTDPAPDGTWRGDHYDMTQHRLLFERIHKTAGYVTIFLSIAVIVLGLWVANAPRWMWLVIAAWWTVLIMLTLYLQFTRGAVDTYQAIWGPSLDHPGNRMRKYGLWTFRRDDPAGPE